MANKGKYYESQFEEATIELLREAHWQYTLGDDIHRKYTDPLIEEDLRNFLAVQYKDKNLTTSEMDGIVANLRNTGGQNDYYALRNAFYSIVTVTILHIVIVGIIRSAWSTLTSSIPTIIFSVASISLSWGKVVRIVALTFCFYKWHTRLHHRIENPTKQNATIRDAHTQICTRYMRDIPALLKYCALAVISDGAKMLWVRHTRHLNFL